MIQYLKLTLFHIKRILKEPKALLLIILPVFLSFLMGMIFNSDNSPKLGKFAYYSHSNYFNQEIYPLLSEEHQGPFLNDEAEIKDHLNQRKADVVYLIPEAFEEDGKLEALSSDGEIQNQFVEEEILRLWKNQVELALYQEYDLQMADQTAPEIKVETSKDFLPIGLMISLFMIFYMMYINASMFAEDLLSMRNNFILKRSIVSNSSGKAILGSVLSAYGLIFLVLNILALLIVLLVNRLPLQYMGIISAYFLVNIAFTVSWILLLVRIFKNKAVLSSVSMGVAIAFVVLPPLVENTSFESLSMLSPFYWTMEGLDFASFFPEGLIIFLMAVTLFTAGSFKVEELARVS